MTARSPSRGRSVSLLRTLGRVLICGAWPRHRVAGSLRDLLYWGCGGTDNLRSVGSLVDPVTVFLWSACLRLRCRAARGPLPHWDRTRGSSAALPRNRGRDYRTPSPRTSAQLLLWMFLYAAAHLGVRNKTVSFMGTPTLRARIDDDRRVRGGLIP